MSRLAVVLVAAVLAAAASGVNAQAWTSGEALWAPTGRACTTCHTGGTTPSLEELRTRVQQGRNDTQAVADALARLNAAIGPGPSARPAMAQFRTGGPNELTNAERANLAAYLADSRASANPSLNPGPTLTVGGIGSSAATTITLFNVGRRALVFAQQQITGDTPQFRVTPVGNGCDAQTVGGITASTTSSCAVNVTYQPSAAPTGQHSLTLRWTHNGEPASTTSVTITGVIGAAPPPPVVSADGGGGGSLSPGWLALLLPAALGARRRLHAVRRASD